MLLSLTLPQTVYLGDDVVHLAGIHLVLAIHHLASLPGCPFECICWPRARYIAFVLLRKHLKEEINIFSSLSAPIVLRTQQT